MSPCVVFFLIFLQVCGSQCARILFLSSLPSPSHQKTFQQVWLTLASKGHEMHVVTPNPLPNNTLPNLIQYDLSDFYEISKKRREQNPEVAKFMFEKPSFLRVFLKEPFGVYFWHSLSEMTFQHPEFQRLVKIKPKFDAVIVEWLFPTMASLSAYFDAPLIGITSCGAPTHPMDVIGNVVHPIVTPDQTLPLKRELSFRDRLLAAFYSIYVRLVYSLVVVPIEDRLARNYLGDDLPYLGDVERNISLLLMNRNQIFHRVMSLVPAVVEFEGFGYEKPKTELSPEIKQFLDSSTNGVVYLSLGSSIKMSKYLTPETIQKFKDAFKDLPFNVLWKWESDTMENKPKNVYISQWLNQTSVLEHPNVKVFITQGGLQSSEEAIAAHKPIIGIPFYVDQTTNVDTCVKYGMGKMIDIDELTPDTLRKYIFDIINNPSYEQNAAKLDQLMQDHPMDGLEKAIWWIEYVIRHKGAHHLRSPAVDMPLYQYLLLDVIGFVVVVLASSFYVLRFIVRKFKRRSGKKKAD